VTAFGRFRAYAALSAGTMFRRQPLASLLSVAAVALAAGMVLRVACTFSATSDRLGEMMADVALHFDRVVTEGESGEAVDAAIARPHPALPEALLGFVRGHGSVAKCVAGSVATVELYPGGARGPGRGGPGGPRSPGGPGPRPSGLASTNITDPMFRMAGWMPGEMAVCPLFSPEEDTAPFGVKAEVWARCTESGALAVPSSLVRQYALAEGASVFLAGAGGRARVPVGAVYDAGRAGAVRGLYPVYAPRGVFESVAGGDWVANRAYVRFRDGADAAAFEAAFEDAVAASGAAASLLGPAHWREAAAPFARGRGGGGFDAIPYSAVFLAVMAALFLLLSTLAMNVQGQRRELAVLRAIGAPSWMPAGTVVVQGLLLALGGWLVGAGYGLWAFLGTLPEASRGWMHAASLARGGLALSAVPVSLATLLACIPAVWMAMRLHPLEAGSIGTSGARTGRRAFAFGAAAMLLHPLLAWTPLAGGPLAQSLVLPAAYLLAMVGAVLTVPGLLRTLARVLARPLGALLRLHPLLLRDHNQGGLWQQTLGASALIVSLAFYLTTAIWGESMKIPFMAGSKAPDAIAVFLPEGPLPEHAGEIAAIPGVLADSAMRLTHLRLEDTDSLRGKFFAGSELILLRADLPGFLDRVSHGLVDGRIGPLGDGECVVMSQMPIADPDAFRIGKPFGVYPLGDAPDAAPSRTELVPVGVLDIPGWQLITKSTRMRRGMNRSLSLVFVNDATFDRYAPSVRENCHWLTLAPGTSMQDLQRALDVLRPYPSAYVKLTDVAGAQAMISRRSDSVIAPLLRLPLMVLGLSSLAVLVSLVAAAWARRQTFALLDALGLTRFQLARLLLGEALLLALVSILLGTLLALLFAQTGILLCNRMMTVRAPYIVPLPSLLIGASATLGSTLAAALLALPALRRRAALAPDRA
jgi:putative ABC transport system permease protein